MTGVGLLVLFRHRTGLGGVNLVAIDLQERFGLRAGYVLLGVDLTILVAAAFHLPPDKLALSVLGAGVLNMIPRAQPPPGALSRAQLIAAKTRSDVAGMSRCLMP